MINKPNVRFHDGQILSEEPLNKAMEAVDDAVDAANEAKEKSEAAIAAAGSAEGAAEDARTYFETLQNVISNLPSSGVDQAMVVDNRARIQVLEGKLDPKMSVPFEKDGYLNDNGVFVAAPGSGWICSDIVPISKGQTYKIHAKAQNGSAVVCLYDANKSLVKKTVATDAVYNNYTETINDDNVRYIRSCTKNDSSVSQAYFEIDATIFDEVKKEINKVNDTVEEIKTEQENSMKQIPFSTNGYINDNGAFVDGATSWKHSDAIPTFDGVQYKITAICENGANMICFYDKEMAVVDIVKGDVNGQKTFVGKAPANAAYMSAETRVEEGKTATFSISNIHSIINIASGEGGDMENIPMDVNGYFTETGRFVYGGTFWKRTGMVATYPGAAYSLKAAGSAGSSLICFYDLDSNVVLMKNTETSGASTLKGKTPAGAYYVVAQSNTTIQDAEFRIENNHSLVVSTLKSRYKYGEKLAKPYSFTGKKMVVFGDSLSKGIASPWGTGVIADSYVNVLASKLGLSAVDNRSQSGTGWTCTGDGEYGQDGDTKVTDLIMRYEGGHDIMWINSGANDYQLNMPIGTINDTGISTVYGALKTVCNHIKTNFPNMEVFFVIPVNISYFGTSMNYQHSMNDYRNAIYEIAMLYDFNIVDGTKVCFPTIAEGLDAPEYMEAMITDGRHPTTLGHKYMGEQIASMLL